VIQGVPDSGKKLACKNGGSKKVKQVWNKAEKKGTQGWHCMGKGKKILKGEEMP